MPRDYTDYTHPERHYEGLVFIPEGKIPEEVIEKTKGLRTTGWNPNGVQLCRVCGWTAYNELCSSYMPRIKIGHTRDNMGLWQIGTQWILRDQPNDGGLGNDYITQEFLRGQPSLDIPLVKEMRQLSGPNDPIQFTLMSRAQGVTLESIWNSLTAEQKSGYSDQLAGYIKQLRQFTAPYAQKVDGTPLGDSVLSLCPRRHEPLCKQVGRTTDEWFDNLVPELRRGISRQLKTHDATLIEKRLQELRDNFPKGEPYTLTHTDFNPTNIIVKDGKIEAIIDWEMAGYYPWWVERYINGAYCAQTAELMKPVWAKLQPEMDFDTFWNEVGDHVSAVHQAYYKCPKEHENMQQGWVFPAFCECKPYAKTILSKNLGLKMRHEIIPPRPNEFDSVGKPDLSHQRWLDEWKKKCAAMKATLLEKRAREEEAKSTEVSSEASPDPKLP